MIRRLRFFPIHCTLVCFVLFWSLKGVSQTTYTISGRITDAQTGDPVPFAGVAIKGKTAGVTTNFEGFYTLKTTQIGDSLMVSSMSYRPKTKAIRKDSISQVINFQLESSEIKLQEVKVYAGENPAYNILRKVVKQKPAHNPNRLTAYEYESYNKIEVDVDNLSQRFKSAKPSERLRKRWINLKRLRAKMVGP